MTDAGRKSFALGLVPKLVGTTLLVTLFVSWLLSQQAIDTIADLKKAQFLARGEAVALTLALSLADPKNGTVESAAQSDFIRRILARESREHGISYIYIQDREGSILAHTFEPHFPPEFVDLNGIERVLPPGQRVQLLEKFQFKSAAGLVDATDIAAPIGDGSLGVVHVGMNRADIADVIAAERSALYGRSGVVALLGVLLGAAVVIFVVARPIQRLSRAARRAASGDFSAVDLGPSGNDEIGALTNTFRDMLGQIKQRDEALAAHNETLEQTVLDRTIELTAANQALHGAKDAAEKATAIKSQFLANMSHEIRTPMNGVIGMTDLLARSPLSEKQQHYTETIRTSGMALLELIEDILDFSKIEAGKLTLRLGDFSLARIIDEACEVLQPRVQARGLVLERQLDPRLPTFVHGDGSRLRQVLLNLLGNAVKFTEEGTISLRVGVTDEYLRFEIEDHGIGIAAENVSALFAAFSQVDDSHTRRFGGTGLGLAICKELVTLMGGEIGVQSDLGQGSCFWFTARLPAVATAANEAPVAAVALESLSGEVLVVEDNLINQAVMVDMLEALGCTAVVVSSGAEAIEATRVRPFSAVLMDCQMPEMDGYEATRRIRREEQESGKKAMPIIALTASALPADRDRALGVGMDDHLPKPVTYERLQAALRHHLAAKPTRRTFEIKTKRWREVSEIFLRTVPVSIDEIKSAIAKNDAQRLREEAHKLKGGCAVIGAERMADAARSIEDFGGWEKVPGLMAGLEREFTEIQVALQRRLSGKDISA